MRTKSDSICSTVYGVLCTCAAAVIGLLWFLNHRARELHGVGVHDLTPLTLPALFLAVLGIALLFRWKPALPLFVFITAFLGMVIIVGALWHSITQTPQVLINIPFGAALLVPLTLMVRHKRSLRISLANGH